MVTSSPFTKAVVNAMRRLYPESLADKSWDNTGLLLEAPLRRDRCQRNSVLLTIDLTRAVADEAIEQQDSVIVSYHPIIFRPLKCLTLADSQQESLLRLAQEGISVYSPHTAVDAVPGGLTDYLVDILLGHNSSDGIKGLLHTAHTRSPLIPSSSTDSPPPIPGSGMGRLVQFHHPQSLRTLIQRVSDAIPSLGGVVPLAIPQGTTIEGTSISSVGVVAGSGGSILRGRNDIDMLFTGEMSHHETLAAIEAGKVVIAPYHTNTERNYLPIMQQSLLSELSRQWRYSRQEFLANNDAEDPIRETEDVEVRVSERDGEPMRLVALGGSRWG